MQAEAGEVRATRRAGEKPIVLVVDDDVLVLRTLVRILDAPDIELATLSGRGGLRHCLAERRLAVVLLDIRLGPTSGLEVLDDVKRMRPDVQVIMMTGFASVDGAVGSMRRGAFDYLSKPFDDLPHIRATLRRALARYGVPSEFASDADTAAPEPAGALPVVRSGASIDPPLSLDAYEKLALERALRENDGDASRAAKALRIGRSTFYRKAARHGLSLTRTDTRREPRTSGRVGPTIPIG